MKMREDSKKTNWDAYYSHPFPLSHLTRSISSRMILSVLRQAEIPESSVFAELGGGGSFFFPYCMQYLRPRSYIIFEKNQVGIDAFMNKYASFSGVKAVKTDILDNSLSVSAADIVMSFGLIEHFDILDTARILKKHFSMAKSGGIVLVSFPTPLQPYPIARRIAETLGLWQFHDERPVPVREVLSVCSSFGKLLQLKINRWAVFTQAIAVWRVL